MSVVLKLVKCDSNVIDNPNKVSIASVVWHDKALTALLHDPCVAGVAHSVFREPAVVVQSGATVAPRRRRPPGGVLPCDVIGDVRGEGDDVIIAIGCLRGLDLSHQTECEENLLTELSCRQQ